MNDDILNLPHEPADRLTQPLARFLRIEALAGAVLVLSVCLAFAAANSPLSTHFLSFWDLRAGIRLDDWELSRSLKGTVNDGLMTLFFFLVTLELKRELVAGELRNPRRAALSLAAALGGMIVPAALYILLAHEGTDTHGWGAVMATDTAFVLGALAILGRRVPVELRLFLLSLGVFDDIGAMLVVSIGYGGAPNWAPLAAAGIGLGLVLVAQHLGVRSVALYILLGVAIWLAMDASGTHPTASGLALGLTTPARSWVSSRRLDAILRRIVTHPPGEQAGKKIVDRIDLRRAGIATREAMSPLERLEATLHPWVAFAILPLFAVANGGIAVSAAEFDPGVATAVFIALLLGKPTGVLVFSILAVASGLAVRPPGLPWRLLAAGSLLTSIGFTMAFLISDFGFSSGSATSAKLGILGAGIVSAAAGLTVLAFLTTPGRPPLAKHAAD